MADAVKALRRQRAGRKQGRDASPAPTSPRTAPSCRSALSTALPGVKRLLLLVEKNPNTLAAMFDITDAVEANVSTRVKMGQSSDVYAVAIMNDGKVLYAKKEIKVTLGGCGG